LGGFMNVVIAKRFHVASLSLIRFNSQLTSKAQAAIPIPPLPVDIKLPAPPKTPRHPPVIVPKKFSSNSSKANQFRSQGQCLYEQLNPLKIPQPEIKIEHPLNINLRRNEEVAHLVDVADRDRFVIVNINGKQHKVMKGDSIMTDKLVTDVGQDLVFDKVLLLGTLNYTIIGRPLVSNVKVLATVEEQTKLAKVIVYKRRPRNRYHKHHGVRARVTVLRINDIVVDSISNENQQILTTSVEQPKEVNVQEMVVKKKPQAQKNGEKT